MSPRRPAPTYDKIVFESDRLIRRRRVRIAMLVALGLSLAGAVLLWPRHAEDRRDLSARFSSITDFGEVNEIDGSWIATVGPDWPGVTDSDLALETCQRLARSVTLGPRGTVTIIGPAGTPIAECDPAGRAQ